MLKKLAQIGSVAQETVLIPRYPTSGGSPSLLGLSQMEANDAIEILKAFRNELKAMFRPKHQQSCYPTNWPVGYGAGLQLIIRNITLFGQWPAPLDSGLLG
jgi:hypothetical protein